MGEIPDVFLILKSVYIYLNNYWKIIGNFCCLSHLGYNILFWQPKKTDSPLAEGI